MHKILTPFAAAFLLVSCVGKPTPTDDSSSSSIEATSSSQVTVSSQVSSEVVSSQSSQSSVQSSSVQSSSVQSSSVSSSSVSSSSQPPIIVSSSSQQSSSSVQSSSSIQSSSSVQSSAPVSSSSQSSSSAPAIVWKHCSEEKEICAFKGRRQVRFGAGDQWVIKAFDQETPCDNDAFGGDPAPGIKKTCQVPDYVELRDITPEPEPGVTVVPASIPLLSYSAASPETDGNQGDTNGQCRTADPDFKANASGTACILTAINPREWIEYSVQVKTDGVFDFIMNLGADVSDQSVSVLVDGKLVGSVNSPSERKFRMLPVTVWRIPMDAGERTIRIRFNGNDLQMSRFEIKESGFASRTRARFARAADDGLDDTALFEEILSAGGVIDIPAGTYDFKPTGEKAGVNVKLSDKNIHVRADANAVFVSKDVDDDLFNLDANGSSFAANAGNSDKKIDISWHGGKIDIRNSYVSTSVPAKSSNDRVGKLSTTDGLSIRAGVLVNGIAKTKVKSVEIQGLEVLSSDTTYRNAGGDSGVFVSSPDKLDMRWCSFKGSRDAAIYVSASPHDPKLGANFTIEYVDMQDAYDGIASKRGASNVNYSNNRIKNVAVGIVVRTQNGSRTRNIKINNNQIEQAERAIAAEITTTGEIKGNKITRLGAPVAGSATTKNPENSYQGISLRGVTGFVVEDNTIEGVATAREPKVGVEIDKFARNGFTTVNSGTITIKNNTYTRLDKNIEDKTK